MDKKSSTLLSTTLPSTDMLKTAKVVGLNSDTDAALALVTSGLLIIVACEAEDAFSKIRQALSEAENFFISSDEPLSAKIPQCLNLIKEQLAETTNLQILIAAVSEDVTGTVLYLLGLGTSLKALLIRHHQQTDLSNMGESGLISGVFLEGDRLILFTLSLQELLGGTLDKIISLPVEMIEDEINLLMPEAQINPLACIILEREVTPKGEILKALEQDNTGIHESRIMNHESRAGDQQEEIKSLVSSKLPKINLKIVALTVIFLLIIGTGFFVWKNKQTASQSTQPQAETKPAVANIYQVNELPVWLDLDLVKKDFQVSNISLSFGKLLSLDLKNKSLVLIDTNNKSQQILAGEEQIGTGKIASLNSDLAFVYSEDKGIIRIDVPGKKATTVAKKDEGWGNIADLFGFAGNIYLLDNVNNQIWKYLPTESGYSDKREYLKEKADLVGAKKMQIDSSVWILKRGGEIMKFTQGVTDNFTVSGLDKSLKDVTAFYITDQVENIYLLDSGNNRLVVLDKKGNYVAQYQSNQLNTFTDLVVDEEKKKVFLLSGSKIYMMELR